MPYEYDNDNDTAITEVKNDRNMTNDELKDAGIKDMVPYKRDDDMITEVKRPIEPSDVGNDFMREYDRMCKSMEDRQITDYYEARRHIQSAMKGDTPIKTGQNRQCLDTLYTTVEAAAALKIQDKIEGKYDEDIHNMNGQYRNEMYKREENVIPQLDGTFNVSDNSD